MRDLSFARPRRGLAARQAGAAVLLAFAPGMAMQVAWAGPARMDAARSAASSLPAISSGIYVTTAARAALPGLCAGTLAYPPQFTWARGAAAPGADGGIIQAPLSARGGTPRIEQYRAGALIAVYSSFANQPGCTYLGGGQDVLAPASAAASGCGPFTRTHGLRLAMSGDEFRVYPAVYAGPYNQPWFGPMWDGVGDIATAPFYPPDHVVIRGIVAGDRRPVILLNGYASDNTYGQAPVYFDVSDGMVMQDINVAAAPGAVVARAGIYVGPAANLTLRRMRVTGFQRSSGNGVFATNEASGTLWLDGVELDHNGGRQGPAHNLYVNGSSIDPAYTLLLTNVWSHDAFYGHLIKSRAQVTTILASYLQGTLPQGTRRLAESYLVDVPNGGVFTLRNSVLTKNASGKQSNATMVSFAAEGIGDTRPQSIDIENNSFIAFSATTDGIVPLTPLGFFFPRLLPGDPLWPAGLASRVLKNAYVGFCGVPYVGDAALQADFSELGNGFAFTTKVDADDAALAAALLNYHPAQGSATYQHVTQPGAVRSQATLGAMD